MKRVVIPVVVLALALSGCTSGSDDSASSPASGGSAVADSDTGAEAPPQPNDEATLARIAPTDSVIRTGDLEVRVDDVPAAAGQAARLVTAAGGALEGEERSNDGEYAVAILRLRIPPGRFDETVTRLSALGEERTRRLSSEDVTEQVIDLDSRLATQRASVDRVRALLSEAQDLGEVVQVEAELTRRTADLESLQARLSALTSRVELGTVTLQLTSDASAPTAVGGPAGFRDGLREGWAAVVALGRGAGVAAGALLPFSPVLVGGAWLVWRSRRAVPA